MNKRAYFDWNATAPLKAEARTAMISVMSNLGNPSSIHTEGRAAKAIIDTARMQLAEAFGASNSDIIFTSGATEAATLALNSKNIKCSKVEHPCISSHCENSLTVDANGKILISVAAVPGFRALLASPPTTSPTGYTSPSFSGGG